MRKKRRINIPLSEKKTKNLNVRLTESDYESLDNIAYKENKSLSYYVREQIKILIKAER